MYRKGDDSKWGGNCIILNQWIIYLTVAIWQMCDIAVRLAKQVCSWKKTTPREEVIALNHIWLLPVMTSVYCCSYQYKIRTYNTKGYTESDWTKVETASAAPAGVLPPTLSHYGTALTIIPLFVCCYIYAIVVLNSLHMLRETITNQWLCTYVTIFRFIIW